MERVQKVNSPFDQISKTRMVVFGGGSSRDRQEGRVVNYGLTRIDELTGEKRTIQ